MLSNRITKFFSGISMEIYLCHMMFFRVIKKLHIEQRMSNDDWSYWITCMLVLASAVLFSLLWEKAEKTVGGMQVCRFRSLCGNKL